ncbi:penicillin-binding protein 1A [Skermanella stibiiresistens SB22]|uniref:Penicillin-binding protein 1A n=1 Tax=Skermanella stibiiresistens SB22 TaxID=1385369 RepID=W9H820_9PROT|nr:penicillin-binding protein 1A [Skermanella stibiiresistens]EWY39953.1 penicillin-binding protein 1A [Skermanella stibiiresistens SB22]
MRILAGILSAVLFLAVVAAGGAVFAIHHFSQGLPEYTQLADYQPPTVTRVHAGDGRVLAEFATERRVFIPIEAMPKRVIRGFISAEDQNFYSHRGVDFVAILRAMVTNVENIATGRRMIGASGITQQVAKNFLLTNEVSFERKIKEAILAFRMEQAFSKDRILELYLNEIFLGNRSYGVAAAALNYFNKPLDELTIAEAAYLAALPKAPNNYHPVRQHDAAIARRNWVIGRMQEDGAITAEEAAEAKAEPLEVRRRDETDYVTADYFAEEVRRELLARFGERSLYEGGYSVRTTVDPKLQDIATSSLRDGLIAYDRKHGWRGSVGKLESFDNWSKQLTDMAVPPGGEIWRMAAVLEVEADEALIGLADGAKGRVPLAELKWARRWVEGERTGPEVKRAGDVVAKGDVILVEPVTKDAKGKDLPAGVYGLRQIPAVQGGLVAMDPHTGRVLAMSGGFSSRISVFNRATQALRQPGSSFKPFVYMAALDNGFTPSSLVMDAPFAIQPGPGQPLWRPQNYSEDYLGATTLRVGIEKSRNVMTVRLANSVGMDKVANYAERFGIVDKLPRVLSMSLGAGETTVLRMTTAYSMIVNGGKKVVPAFIDRIQDHTGKVVFKHDTRPCPSCSGIEWSPDMAVPDVPDARESVIDPRTAYQMVSILEGVVQRGTAKTIASIGKPLAGKTGTTNDALDAWFVGFSPDLAVGLYIGFDQPRSLGAKETGGTLSAPVFKDFMADALKGEPATPFRMPPGIRLVRVDAATGQLAEPGQRNAIWEAFKPGTEPREGDYYVLDGSDVAAGGSVNGGAYLPPGSVPPPGRGQDPAPASSGTGGLY